MFGIAVIGCGYWGPNHLRSFVRLPDCEVTAVDVDDRRLAAVSREFPGVGLERQFDRVLESSRVCAVVIATPTSTHFPLVRRALLAGKHVLCEKPLCTSSAEARQLIRIAEERNLVLMVGHIFLFNPGIEAIATLLRDGALGEVHYCSAQRTNFGPIRWDINAAYDLAAHDIAVFNWLLDALPEEVTAQGGAWIQPGVEDFVCLNLTYPRGCLVNIQASWLAPRKVRQMTVIGSKRMVLWDDLDAERQVTVFDRSVSRSSNGCSDAGPGAMTLTEGQVTIAEVIQDEPLRRQNEAFLNAIRTGDTFRSDGEFGLGVVAVLEAANKSLSQCGVPVQVVPQSVSCFLPV